jgi:hypothetical protein
MKPIQKPIKTENSQDYAKKPQRNFMFMNSASAQQENLYSVHCPPPPSPKLNWAKITTYFPLHTLYGHLFSLSEKQIKGYTKDNGAKGWAEKPIIAWFLFLPV